MERDEDNPDTTSIHLPPSQTYHDNHQQGEPPAAAPDSPIGPLYDSGEEEDDNDFTFLPENSSVAPEVAGDSNGLYLLDNIQMGVELLQLCSQAQVPLYFYDRILRIFKKFVDRGTKVSTVPSRELLMKHLKSKIPFIEPQSFAITSTEDIVPKFSFLHQIKDLFCTEYFQNVDSCCVNVDEQDLLFKMYDPPPGEGLGEVLGAKWYQETYQNCIGDNPMYVDPVSQVEYHNWLLPVIFYNDKTGVSAMEGSYSLEPLMFTLGVIRHTFREKEDAWRHLGFIPTRSGMKKRKDGIGCAAEQSLAFTHECLSILLKDLVDLQANPPLLTLKLFGTVYQVRLLLEVAFVIGDQLSQDTHCCQKKINGGGAGHVHRSCLTSFLNASSQKKEGCQSVPKSVLDNLCNSIWLWEDKDKREAYYQATQQQFAPAAPPRDVLKQFATVARVRSQVAREILEKVFSLYPVRNAWSSLSFGSNNNGIHRATLDDPMHYNSTGLFSYLAQIAFGGLLPKEAQELEEYLREDFSMRSSVWYDLPQGKFSFHKLHPPHRIRKGRYNLCTLLLPGHSSCSFHLPKSNSSPAMEVHRHHLFHQRFRINTIGSLPHH